MNMLAEMGIARDLLNRGKWENAKQYIDMHRTMLLCLALNGAAIVTNAGYVLRPMSKSVFGSGERQQWVCYYGECRPDECSGFEMIDPYAMGTDGEAAPMHLCGYHEQERHDDI